MYPYLFYINVNYSQQKKFSYIEAGVINGKKAFKSFNDHSENNTINTDKMKACVEIMNNYYIIHFLDTI